MSTSWQWETQEDSTNNYNGEYGIYYRHREYDVGCQMEDDAEHENKVEDHNIARKVEQSMETFKMRKIVEKKTMEIQDMMRKEYGMIEDNIPTKSPQAESPRKVTCDIVHHHLNDDLVMERAQKQKRKFDLYMVDEIDGEVKLPDHLKKHHYQCRVRMERGTSLLKDGIMKNKRLGKVSREFVRDNDHVKLKKTHSRFRHVQNVSNPPPALRENHKSTIKYIPSLFKSDTSRVKTPKYIENPLRKVSISIVVVQQSLKEFLDLHDGALTIECHQFHRLCTFLFGEDFENNVAFYLWTYEVGIVDWKAIHISKLQISFFNQFRVETLEDYRHIITQRYAPIQSLALLRNFLGKEHNESIQKFLQHIFIWTLNKVFKNKRAYLIPLQEFQRLIQMFDPQGSHLHQVLEFSANYPHYKMVSFDNFIEYFHWSQTILPDCSNYNGQGDAWPLFFDDLVTWMIQENKKPPMNQMDDTC